MAFWIMNLTAYGKEEQLEAIKQTIIDDKDWWKPNEGEPEIYKNELHASWDGVQEDLKKLVKKFKKQFEKQYKGVVVDLDFESENGYGICKTKNHKTIGNYYLEWPEPEYFNTFDELKEACKIKMNEESDEEFDIDWDEITCIGELEDALADNDCGYDFICEVETI